MKDQDKETPQETDLSTITMSTDGAALLARYGDELEGEDLSEKQKQEFLIALYQIMVAFVDLGFSIKAGEKFSERHDFGMDDVLRYLHLEETAHETVAPRLTPNAEED